MKKIEMHCHSTLSDGKNILEEVINEANRVQLDFLTLTDHDTISPKDFQKSLRDSGIETCDSVEISARNFDLEKSLHLVSYANIFNKSLHDVLENSRAWKMKMKWGQFDSLVSQQWFIGDRVEFDSFMRNIWREPDTSNKYDMSRYLMSHTENKEKALSILWELCTSKDIVWHFYLECLKRWWDLYDIYWYEVDEYEPSVEQTIDEVVLKSWWLVSIAHPNVTFWWKKWGISEFERTLWNYVDKGVRGVEINTMASPEWVESILNMRDRFDLVLTFWSDCHEIGYDGRDGKHSSIWNINPNVVGIWDNAGGNFIETEFNKFKNSINLWNE